MQTLFLFIADMSAAGGIVVLAVLLARLLLKKAPKKFSYFLWSAAAVRLCCPIRLRSSLSLFGLISSLFERASASGEAELLTAVPPSVSGVPETVSQIAGAAESVFESSSAAVQSAGQALTSSAEEAVSSAGAHSLGVLGVLSVVWAAVFAAMLLYAVINYALLRRRLASAVRIDNGVYLSDKVRSPFVMGLFRPVIYMPFGLDAQTAKYALEHERLHIRRGDNIVKAFAFALLAAHWFNPLCWLAFVLMSRDMEMSCDEAVLASGGNVRKMYSRALLDLAAGKRFPAPEPLAFGENAVKSRIKNALNWKKPKLFITFLAALLCAAVITACATDPKLPDDARDEAAPEDAVSTSEPANGEAVPEPTADWHVSIDPQPTQQWLLCNYEADSASFYVEPAPRPVSMQSMETGSVTVNTLASEYFSFSYAPFNTKYREWFRAAGRLLKGENAKREVSELHDAGLAAGSVYFRLTNKGLDVFAEAKEFYIITLSDGTPGLVENSALSAVCTLDYGDKITTLPPELAAEAYAFLSEYSVSSGHADVKLDKNVPLSGYYGEDYAVFMLMPDGGSAVTRMYRRGADGVWRRFASPAQYGRYVTGASILSDTEAYVCFSSGAYSSPFVCRTTDGGATWRSVALDAPAWFPMELAFSPVFDGAHGIMIVHGSNSSYPRGCTGWFETTDGGSTWEFRSYLSD